MPSVDEISGLSNKAPATRAFAGKEQKMKGPFFRPLSVAARLTASVCIMLLLPLPGTVAFAREGECENNPFPDTNPGPGSLKQIRPIDPPQLGQYVRDRQAAVALGKALFWDMQVGSDGIQSCASCHFRAGADPRSKGQLAPGGVNNARQVVDMGLNYQLTSDDFPLHKLSDPTNRGSRVIRSVDDVVSSAGVKAGQFHSTTRGESQDEVDVIRDSVFNVGGKNVRRSEPRNTPTVINAAFNRRQFWDGRADEIFNGVNPFGVRDPNAHVLKVDGNKVEAAKIRITFASAASQAVGPPLSDLEMGSFGRDFKHVGKRLLTATPLKKQIVAADDSALGSYSRSKFAGSPQKGLAVPYLAMVMEAFQPQWWASTDIVEFDSNGKYKVKKFPGRQLNDNEYAIAEFNFSLFFGLAIQLYEATLISDDAPIDRFFEGNPTALTRQQQEGLELFQANACAACHSGAEFTNASARIIYGANGEPGEVIERMPNGNCEVVIYDQSFYNIGIRPWEEDLGIGNNDPFGNPLAISNLLTMDPALVPSRELLTISYPNIASPAPQRGERTSTMGAFKVPSLRNIALTAPYFHNGGQATLRQVVEFYNRGGDFREHNSQFVDFEIGKLNLTNAQIDAIVAFLHSLTDARILQQKAPFDHPQLFVPDGAAGDSRSVQADRDGTALDVMVEIPAVGKNGGAAPKAFLER
jgi:cytochrome c peroxidase